MYFYHLLGCITYTYIHSMSFLDMTDNSDDTGAALQDLRIIIRIMKIKHVLFPREDSKTLQWASMR